MKEPWHVAMDILTTYDIFFLCYKNPLTFNKFRKSQGKYTFVSLILMFSYYIFFIYQGKGDNGN